MYMYGCIWSHGGDDGCISITLCVARLRPRVARSRSLFLPPPRPPYTAIQQQSHHESTPPAFSPHASRTPSSGGQTPTGGQHQQNLAQRLAEEASRALARHNPGMWVGWERDGGGWRDGWWLLTHMCATTTMITNKHRHGRHAGEQQRRGDAPAARAGQQRRHAHSGGVGGFDICITVAGRAGGGGGGGGQEAAVVPGDSVEEGPRARDDGGVQGAAAGGCGCGGCCLCVGGGRGTGGLFSLSILPSSYPA